MLFWRHVINVMNGYLHVKLFVSPDWLASLLLGCMPFAFTFRALVYET